MPVSLYKKFSIPPAVKVGFMTYNIEFVRDLRDTQHNRLFGQQDYTNSRISLDDSTTSADQVHNTVLHEVMHAVWKMMELPHEPEEDYVSRLTNGLHTVFQENPKLVDMFKKGK